MSQQEGKVIGVLGDGKVIAISSGSAQNTGTTAADIDVTVTFDILKKVTGAIAVFGGPSSGFVLKSISDNKVTVTALSVPAGETVNASVVAVGY